MEKNTTYEVYYKDYKVFTINGGGEVHIFDRDIMPMEIYVEEDDDIESRANNIVNFNTYCSERIIPLDRKYAKEILAYYGFDNAPSIKARADIGIATRCLSLNDCFWVKKSSETIKWNEVNLFTNSLENSVMEIPLLGHGFTVNRENIDTPDIHTDGKAPKAWKRQGDQFFLLKRDNGQDSVTKEVEASTILRELFGDSVSEYKKDTFADHAVSVCKCFTDQTTNMIKADYYSIFRMNQNLSFKDDLESTFRRDLEIMILADYLVGNTDRHSRNWGILYSLEEKNGCCRFVPLRLSFLYDFDHAFESSGQDVCQPYLLIGKRISQEEAAKELSCKYRDILEKEIDLSKYKYGEFVQKRLNVLRKI